MRDLQPTRTALLACLDLTRLVENDTSQAIEALCRKARQSYHGTRVAAVCVYPQWLPVVQQHLAGMAIKFATVVNFPNGDEASVEVIKDIHKAIVAGADEIDFVFPHTLWLSGQGDAAKLFISAIMSTPYPRRVIWKCIIETGALITDENIAAVIDICLDNGVDFIKTSTGKCHLDPDVGAHVDTIYKHLSNRKAKAGVKVSGGISTVALANNMWSKAYLHGQDVGYDAVGANRFRIGASGLFDLLISEH